MVPDVQLQCAAVAAWGSAALRGVTSLDAAIDVLRTLRVDVLFDSPLDGGRHPLPLAVGSWRSRGIGGWRFVPVVAGDSGGLPGPSSLFAQAVDAGAAIVSLSGPTVALVPTDDGFLEPGGSGETPSQRLTIVFHEVPCADRGATPTESLADLDRSLLTAVNEVTERFERLEVAGWREEVLDLLRTWDDVPPLPPGTPARAQRLAARGGRLMALVDLAVTDGGGSRTASEMSLRAEDLRHLAQVARAAQAAGWNAAALNAGV